MEKSELSSRLATGLILVLATVFFVVVGRIYLFLILELLLILAALEFFRILNIREFLPNFLGIGAAILIGLGFYINRPVPLLTIPLVIALSLQLTQRSGYTVDSIAITIMGIIYPALFLSHMLPLRNMGVSHALIPLLYTWVFDTSAYLIGSKFGRRKITRRISPGKSLEGTLGGVFVAIVAGLLAKSTFAQFLSLPHVLIMGAIIPLTGQLGDLFESLIKRSVQLKDSSSLLPGHGGILDRLDSLTFAIPVTYYYLLWFVD